MNSSNVTSRFGTNKNVYYFDNYTTKHLAIWRLYYGLLARSVHQNLNEEGNITQHEEDSKFVAGQVRKHTIIVNVLEPQFGQNNLRLATL